VNNVKERTSPLTAVIMIPIALIVALPRERLADRTTIQGHDVSVLEAIFHVVEHFSGHTGQIIYITKMLTGADLGFYSYLSKPAPPATTTPSE